MSSDITVDQDSIARIQDFSSTLAGILLSLEQRVKETPQPIVTATVDTKELEEAVSKNLQRIELLESSYNDLNGRLEDSVGSHKDIQNKVQDFTKNVLSDIQAELLDLRDVTKTELHSLQGSLTQIIIENMANLAVPQYHSNVPPSSSSVGTSSHAGGASGGGDFSVSDSVLQRLAALEKKSLAQDITIAALMKQLTTDKGLQDRYDSLSSKIRDVERVVEKHTKSIQNDAKNVLNLKTSGQKVERALNLLDGKLNTLTLNMGRRLSMFEGMDPGAFAVSLTQLEPTLESTNENEMEDEDSTQIEVTTTEDLTPLERVEVKLKELEAAPRTRATMIKMEMLMHEKNKVEKDEGIVGHSSPKALSPTAADTSTNFSSDNNKRKSSAPSEDGLSILPENDDDIVIEVILKKLENIEKQLQDNVAFKFEDIYDTQVNNLQKMQKTEQRLHELEEKMEHMANNLAEEAAAISQKKPEVEKQTKFNNVVDSTKDHWTSLLEDLNERIGNMDFIAKQLDRPPDDEHVQLMHFRDEINIMLETIDKKVIGQRPEIIDELQPMFEAVVESAKVLAIQQIGNRQREKLNPDYDGELSKTPELLLNACHATDSLLEDRISKIDLKRKLELLEAEIHSKVNKNEFVATQEEVKDKLAMKADQVPMEILIGKKVSVMDIQKFRESVFDEIDSIRGMMLVANKNSAPSVDNSGEINDLQKRFEMLYKQFQDVQKKIGFYVPRTEVEQAITALLEEVGTMKLNSVDKTTFVEKMKKKADNVEVDRLLQLLSGSVGMPPGSASAMHAKCLVCDKPVYPFGASLRPESPTMGYDKAMDNAANNDFRPDTSPKKYLNSRNHSRPQSSETLMSRTDPLSNENKLRITTEINVLRNSMDTLPALASATSHQDSGDNSKNRNQQLMQHSKRVRASVGGGIGPKYQMDSR